MDHHFPNKLGKVDGCLEYVFLIRSLGYSVADGAQTTLRKKIMD